jgi:SAM-dependent methyltransferase
MANDNYTVSNSSLSYRVLEGQAAKAVTRDLESCECLICGGREHRPVFEEFGVQILRCKRCRHVFSSYAGDAHFDGFWGDEVPQNEHFYWSQARAKMHGDFRRRFMEGRSGRLLDMGCGLGFFLKAMSACQQWEAHGCEISPAAVRYARETLGLQNVMVGRLQDVNLQQHSFDIITMWDVLDHILNPDPLLARCHDLLKQDGMLFIRLPNVFNQLLRARVKKAVRGMRPGVSYMMARDHFHHYSQKSIASLLERNGFRRVEITHLHPIEGLQKSGLVARGVKRLSFQAVRGLAVASMGHLNFDNLFVIGKKS